MTQPSREDMKTAPGTETAAGAMLRPSEPALKATGHSAGMSPPQTMKRSLQGAGLQRAGAPPCSSNPSSYYGSGGVLTWPPISCPATALALKNCLPSSMALCLQEVLPLQENWEETAPVSNADRVYFLSYSLNLSHSLNGFVSSEVMHMECFR